MDEIDDYNDASWAELQAQEERMLSDDAGYAAFLAHCSEQFYSTTKETKNVISKNHG